MQRFDCAEDLRKLILKHLGSNFLSDGKNKKVSDFAVDSLIMVEFIFSVEEYFNLSIAEGADFFVTKDITTDEFFERMKQLTCGDMIKAC